MRETFIRTRRENMEECGTVEGVTNKSYRREVNPIVEGSPVSSNVIHICELAPVTTDHELLKSVLGRVDPKPSDVQLLHT